jgi:hypothetical protein
LSIRLRTVEEIIRQAALVEGATPYFSMRSGVPPPIDLMSGT